MNALPRLALLVATGGALSLALAVGLPGRARAETTLLSLDARLSGGLAFGGGAGQSTTRAAPLSLGLQLEWTLRDDPMMTLYGGVLLEGIARLGVGADVGVRFHPAGGALHFGAGAVAMLTPYTLGGVEASGGVCHGFGGGAKKTTRACGDVAVTAFVVGDDLPASHVAAQLLLVAGAEFDVW